MLVNHYNSNILADGGLRLRKHFRYTDFTNWTVSRNQTQGVHISRSETPRRNHQLDFLRIVFATLVLLAHAPELTDGDRSRELLSRLTRSGFSFGDVGVAGFFLLSGFLIVKSWQQNSELSNFLRNRLLRIVPGYLVAAILSTIVVGLLAPGIPGFFHNFDHHYVVSVLTLGSPMAPPVLPGMPYPHVNGSLWTIPYEFRCYLMVAVFGLCGLLRRPVVWLIVTVIFLIIISSSTLQGHMLWHKFYVFTGDPTAVYHLTSPFLVGGCYFLFRQRIRFRPLFAAAALIALILIAALYPKEFEVVFIVCGGYLLFYFATLALPPLAFMSRVPDISYGIYIYGWPVESLLIWYYHASPWVTFSVSVVVCFVFGYLSWHLIERPMLTLKCKAIAPLPIATL
jgi:peptidoglycan/LPS O-acetylase OafA/YrhL